MKFHIFNVNLTTPLNSVPGQPQAGVLEGRQRELEPGLVPAARRPDGQHRPVVLHAKVLGLFRGGGVRRGLAVENGDLVEDARPPTGDVIPVQSCK